MAEAASHDSKAHSARVAAGQMLLELKRRVEDGEIDDGYGQRIKWWDWYHQRFTKSRRDAERCMRLAEAADPVAAAEAERERNRAYKAAQREREAKAATDVSRNERDHDDRDDDGPGEGLLYGETLNPPMSTWRDMRRDENDARLYERAVEEMVSACECIAEEAIPKELTPELAAKYLEMTAGARKALDILDAKLTEIAGDLAQPTDPRQMELLSA